MILPACYGIEFGKHPTITHMLKGFSGTALHCQDTW